MRLDDLPTDELASAAFFARSFGRITTARAIERVLAGRRDVIPPHDAHGPVAQPATAVRTLVYQATKRNRATQAATYVLNPDTRGDTFDWLVDGSVGSSVQNPLTGNYELNVGGVTYTEIFTVPTVGQTWCVKTNGFNFRPPAGLPIGTTVQLFRV